MTRFWLLFVAALLPAQTPAGVDMQLAIRMAQLMESTAAAVPGLVRASDPLKQNAAATLEALQKTPGNPALTYRFMTQMRAYLALSDSLARPAAVPLVADQQFTELREDLQRMQRSFEAVLEKHNSQSRERDTDLSGLRIYAAENAQTLPASKGPRVIFFGSTAVSAWKLNEYFTGRDFLNRGVPGQTSLQLLGRFMQDVVALKPRAAVILTEDADEAGNVVESNLSTLGTLAKASGIRALFASLPPGDRPPGDTRELNRWLQDYCRREGFIYIDYYTAVATPDGKLQPDLSDDKVRPNAKGYRVMSPIFLDAINRTVAGNPDASEDAKQKRRFRLPGKPL